MDHLDQPLRGTLVPPPAVVPTFRAGDLVKRAGINPIRINGLVLKTSVEINPWRGTETQTAQVLWPDKTCEWTEMTWLRRMDDA